MEFKISRNDLLANHGIVSDLTVEINIETAVNDTEKLNLLEDVIASIEGNISRKEND